MSEQGLGSAFSELEWTVPAEVKERLKLKSIKELDLIKKNPTLQGLREHFGNITAINVATCRSYLTELINEKRKAPEVRADGMMTAVWQGKVEMTMNQTTTEVVLETQDTVIKTGLGPILALDTVLPENQYIVSMMSNFLRETSDSGIQEHVKDVVPSFYSGVNMAPLIKIAAALERQRAQFFTVKENLSGLLFQRKLNNLFNSVGPEATRKLMTMFVVQVLRVGKSFSESQQLYAKALAPNEKPAHIFQVFKSEQDKKNKCANFIWGAPYKVPIGLSKISKARTETHPLVQHVDWISMVTSAMGGTSINALAASYGLCPGISESEAAVIRFVTVAMVYASKKHIVVSGPVTALTLLHSSLKALDQANFTNYLENVSYSPYNLKATAAAAMSALFPENTKYGKFLVAWHPRSTSIGKTVDGMVRESELYYAPLLSKYTNYAIYREVLDPQKNKKYFLDGIPNLLTYWETTDSTLSFFCLTAKGYAEQSLVEVPYEKLFERSRQCALVRLSQPFAPSSVRSFRIMAVKGSPKLTVIVGEDGEVDLSYSTFVVDESQLEQDSSDESRGEESSYDPDPNSTEPPIIPILLPENVQKKSATSSSKKEKVEEKPSSKSKEKEKDEEKLVKKKKKRRASSSSSSEEEAVEPELADDSSMFSM